MIQHHDLIVIRPSVVLSDLLFLRAINILRNLISVKVKRLSFHNFVKVWILIANLDPVLLPDEMRKRAIFTSFVNELTSLVI